MEVPPKYEEEYLNPCWWENVTFNINPYEKNKFLTLEPPSGRWVLKELHKTIHFIVNWWEQSTPYKNENLNFHVKNENHIKGTLIDNKSELSPIKLIKL